MKRLIVIGGSAGSLSVVKKILGALPKAYPWPIAIVIHYSRGCDALMLDGLQQTTGLPVEMMMDKQTIITGHVYLAPSDYHALLDECGCFSLSMDEAKHHCRPAIDVLFSTVAEAFGSYCVGILLSGANEDGAAGLLEIKQRGGHTLVQTPASAEIATMPQAAIDLGAANEILDIESVIRYLLLEK